MNHKIKTRKLFFIFTICFGFLFSFIGFSKPEPVKSEYLKVLKWRCIGPHRGGRVIAVTGHPTKKDVFYFGGTGSGVWKTTNGGKTWKNVSDKFFKTSSVGAITLAPSNPNIIYVGMGECCLRGNISHGDGVYKSSDAGKTWEHIGLADTRFIARIRVHPQNSDILYAAALGHAFGPNKERGVFRSTDGGKTWKNVLFTGEKAGAIDLIMDPVDPRVLYAASWEVQRFPWGVVNGGPGSAIYKTTDSGTTWKDISENTGLPKGIKGRIGLTVSAANPERIWAIIEAEKKGIYRSDDGGNNWQLITTKPELFQRPWYYHHIKADPRDPDTLYVMNVEFWKTTDGGKTFKQIPTPHGDNHDLWIDANDPLRMIEGNDGGAAVTFDGGENWSGLYNQPTAQFYHVTTDNRFPYRVYGAQQDNSTICVPSRSARGAITRDEWYSVGGCESGYIAVHPGNPDIVYAGCYDGQLTRYDHKLRRQWDVSVWPENPMGWGAKDLKYRFQWTYPILISPHDANVLYVAGNHVFRSDNEGRSWEVISPDLTRNDKSKLESSGGPLTKDNTSVEYYCTIFALAESPIKKGLLWAGTDDGLVHVSPDGGKNWENVTPTNIPQWSLISIIEPSHFDPAAAFLAATRYKLDDFQPYLFVTRDYGKTWKKITTGIPADDFTRVIREDPNREGLVYAGTETGVYFSVDEGNTWQSLQLNLPVTPIHDMVVHDNDLVLATHGRSFWILDDLTLLYQVLQMKPGESVYLFTPGKTVRFLGSSWSRERPVNAGESLPAGVLLNYYLKEKPTEEQPVTVTLLDAEGKTIRTYTQKPKKKEEPPVPAKAGMNRFTWNFSYAPSREVKGAVFWGPDRVAPLAIPGTYRVRLSVGEKQVEKSFELVKDPNLPVTQEEYRQQFDFLLAVREKLSRTHDAVNEIRGIRNQMDWYLTRTRGKSYFDKIEVAVKALKEKLQPIEDELIQHKAKAVQDLLNYPVKLNNKLAALGAWVVQYSEGAPTQQALAVFADLSKQVDKQLNRLKQIIETDAAAFNRLIKDLEVPAIMLEHLDKPHGTGDQ